MHTHSISHLLTYLLTHFLCIKSNRENQDGSVTLSRSEIKKDINVDKNNQQQDLNLNSVSNSNSLKRKYCPYGTTDNITTTVVQVESIICKFYVLFGYFSLFVTKNCFQVFYRYFVQNHSEKIVIKIC